MAEELSIIGLGRRGEGIAERDGKRLRVPFALPGEAVTARTEGDDAALVAVSTPSPHRAVPICDYFGRCGGCAVQHMDDEIYRGWKQGLVAQELERAAIPVPALPLLDAHGEGRRRVTFHLRRVDGALRAGFMAARSHELVPIARCPVAVPALAAAAPVAEALATCLGGTKPLDIQLTATLAGLDADIRGHGPIGEGKRAALTRAAQTLDLARLSLHGDIIVAQRGAEIAMGKAAVIPPAGGFLQATAAGEAALADAVMRAMGKARHIADLFAGCGPFALRLAEGAQVHAVEAEAAALLALDRAARATPGLRRITTETRDLFRRPLLRQELERFDAVVLDPPRAGAMAQAQQLAVSSVPLVVMVSCDLATFARDVGFLRGGGYEVDSVLPIDQFRYSRHVELVGILRRAPTKGRRR